MDSNNTASGFGGGSAVGVQWNTNSINKIMLAPDTDCDGDMSEGETVYTNCSELDSSWTPQWSSLVSYWKMNEASWNGTAGQVLDAKGSNNGQSVSTANTSSPGRVGRSGGLLNQGANIEYVTVPHNASLNLSQLSISAWVRPTGWGGSNGGRIVRKGASTATQNFDLGIQSSITGVYFVGAGQLNASSTITLNKWHHVVATSSSSGTKIYINGVLAAQSAAVVPGATNVYNVTIGTFHSLTNRRWMGGLDDVAIWSSVLTNSEVQAIYARQSAQYSGSIASRVMDYGSSRTWSGLKWLTTLPFGKELTGDVDGSGTITSADSETSTDYPSLVGSTGSTSDNDLMSGIQGLWRFNETAADFSGSLDFADSSGNGRHLTDSGTSTYANSGKFGVAAGFAAGSQASASLSGLSGDGTYSVSAWINPSSTSLMGILGWGDSSTALGAAGLYINSTTTGNIHAEFGGTNEFGEFNQASKPGYCTANLRQWNHIVLVKTPGRIDTTSTIYVNGASCGTFSNARSTPSIANSDLTIGTWANKATEKFSGQIDEVAIWNRALHTDEIKQLYRRGANRIKHQVRTCTASDCSDNPTWIGPDNTNGSYFSELNSYSNYNYDLATCAGTSIIRGSPSLLFSCFTSSLSNLTSQQYIQYRTILESDDTSTNCNYGSGATWCSPELQSVEVKP